MTSSYKNFTLISPFFSNDSFEGEPEEKRRKTTNVVIDQSTTENKVLIDNIPDNSGLLEEVRNQKDTSDLFDFQVLNNWK